MFRHAMTIAAALAASTAFAEAPLVSGNAIAVGYQLPYDVNLPQGGSLRDIRNAYNTFSWNTFIALSWPAAPSQRGQPDTGAGIGGAGARVWETYKSRAEVFVDPPALPTPWNAPPPSPPAMCKADEPGIVLAKAGEFSDPVLQAVVQPMSGKTGFLVDQNGNKVWIDALMNQVAFSFIYDHRYYDADVQIAAKSSLLFPVVGDNATKTVGPIDVKPSWKVLVAGKDDASRFYNRTAYILENNGKKCSKQTVGLVGFHLAVKTKTAPQWIWASFEHKDNAPSCKPWTGSPRQTCDLDWQKSHYSFADPGCKDCKINQVPTPATASQPVQVVRIIPIPDYVSALNEQAAALLKGTVWANYELLDTQYPSDPTQFYGSPLPQYLANTTLETYNQGTTPVDPDQFLPGLPFPGAYGLPALRQLLSGLRLPVHPRQKLWEKEAKIASPEFRWLSGAEA